MAECNCGEVGAEEGSQTIFEEAVVLSQEGEEDGGEDMVEGGETEEGRRKKDQKINEIGSSMDSEIRRGSFQEEGGSGLGGSTGDSQVLGESIALTSSLGGEEMEGVMELMTIPETAMSTGSTTTIPEVEMNTGSTTEVDAKSGSWLDYMDLEEISDTDDGQMMERTREGYRKRKAVGRGGEKGWKKKETG